MNALTHRRGQVYNKLVAFKEGRGSGWEIIFGRLITAWLEDWWTYDDYDLVLINPTHVNRSPRHMEMILDAAIKEDPLGNVPWDDPADPTLVKREMTTSSRGGRWREKYDAANELWHAIEVKHPQRLRDARVLVVDDVTTTLLQLEVVSQILHAHGAAAVDGLVIARA